MTCVVANRECMAGDTRVTSGGPICHARKLHRVGDSIFGIAGDIMIALTVIAWLNTKRDKAQLYKLIPESHRDSVEILELSRDGLACWNGWGVRMPILDNAYGVGTGAMSALQALKRGLTPEQAVSETFDLDECSGGLVEVEHLEQKKPRRKR